MNENLLGARMDVVVRFKFVRVYVIIAILAFLVLLNVSYLRMTNVISGELFPIASLLIALLAATAFLAAFLKHLGTYYTITDREIIATQGIITRSKRSIQYTKVDNITVQRNVIDLILGTGSIEVDTPGGPSNEIDLEFIDAKRLPELETLIKGKMRAQPQQVQLAETDLSAIETVAQGKPIAKGKRAKKRKSEE